MGDIKVIVVPANLGEPATEATISSDMDEALKHLGKLVGAALVESARYDEDALLRVDGAGLWPANDRMTRYAFGESLAVSQNRTNPANPAYFLYGTVVITGSEQRDGTLREAPQRLLDRLNVLPPQAIAQVRRSAPHPGATAAGDFPEGATPTGPTAPGQTPLPHTTPQNRPNGGLRP